MAFQYVQARPRVAPIASPFEKKYAPRNVDYAHDVVTAGGPSWGWALCPHWEDTCVMTWARGYGLPGLDSHIHLESLFPIRIDELIREYDARRIVLKRVELKGLQWIGAAWVGDLHGWINLYGEGVYVGGWPYVLDFEWKHNVIQIGVDVTPYRYIQVGPYQVTSSVIDHAEQHIAAVVIVLEIETEVETFEVTITVVDEEGKPVAGAKVTVNTIESGFTDEWGEVIFWLRENEYTAQATVTIEGRKHSGSTTFTVPAELYPEITVVPEVLWYEWLPWVGVGIIALIGGVIVFREVARWLRPEGR